MVGTGIVQDSVLLCSAVASHGLVDMIFFSLLVMVDEYCWKRIFYSIDIQNVGSWICRRASPGISCKEYTYHVLAYSPLFYIVVLETAWLITIYQFSLLADHDVTFITCPWDISSYQLLSVPFFYVWKFIFRNHLISINGQCYSGNYTL
jgi:hypothetical protein